MIGSLFVWMRASAFQPNGYVAQALNVEGQTLLQGKVTSYVQDDLLTQERAKQLATEAVAPLPINDQQKEILAAGIATGVRSQIGNAVNAFFESGPGQQFAAALSTRLSEEAVKLVREDSGVFQFEGDAIVFNTQPIVEGARAKAEELLGPFARFLPPPRQEGYKQIVLVQGSTVSAIQSAISTIWLMSWLLPTLFVVLLIAGIIVARKRRAVAFRAMIAILIGVVIAVVAVKVAKRLIVNLVQEGPGQQVVDSILSAATSELVSQTLWIMLITAIVGFVLWMLGPDQAARHSRGWLGARWRDLVAEAPSEAGRVTQFARRYRFHLEIGGVVLCALSLALVSNIDAGTWVLALVSLGVWVLLIEYASCATWMRKPAQRIHERWTAPA